MSNLLFLARHVWATLEQRRSPQLNGFRLVRPESRDPNPLLTPLFLIPNLSKSKLFKHGFQQGRDRIQRAALRLRRQSNHIGLLHRDQTLARRRCLLRAFGSPSPSRSHARAPPSLRSSEDNPAAVVVVFSTPWRPNASIRRSSRP